MITFQTFNGKNFVHKLNINFKIGFLQTYSSYQKHTSNNKCLIHQIYTIVSISTTNNLRVRFEHVYNLDDSIFIFERLGV